MITNGSVYNKDLPSNEVRVLVMRHWPRGIKCSDIDLWIPAAAPSAALLKRYTNQEITWEKFAESYRAEQTETKGGCVYVYVLGTDGSTIKGSADFPERPIEWLAHHCRHVEQATGRALSLLCWERKGNCHRHLLQEMIQEILEPVIVKSKVKTVTNLTAEQRETLQQLGCVARPYISLPHEFIFAASCTSRQIEGLRSLSYVIGVESMPTYDLAEMETSGD